ncbi:MAG: thiamine diphosphokinase, partial [Albidovulum sp.]
MNRPIVDSDIGVTLVAGGPVGRVALRMALREAPVLVAADGGADRALRHGEAPVAVIGDLDSISPAAQARIGAARIHRMDEQETTDFDKCLRSVRAPFLLALGVAGGRLDHALAALSSLVRHQQAGGAPCVIVGNDDLVFAAPRQLDLRLPVGERLSLFPLSPVTGESSGLRWPIGGLKLAPDGRIGTSNAVDAGVVQLRFDQDGMLVVLPRRRLRAVLAALLPRVPGKPVGGG